MDHLKVKEFIISLKMAESTKVNFKIIILMDKVSCFIQINQDMKDNFNKECVMVKEYFNL